MLFVAYYYLKLSNLKSDPKTYYYFIFHTIPTNVKDQQQYWTRELINALCYCYSTLTKDQT